MFDRRESFFLQSIAVKVKIKGALDGLGLLKNLAQHCMGKFVHEKRPFYPSDSVRLDSKLCGACSI